MLTFFTVIKRYRPDDRCINIKLNNKVSIKLLPHSKNMILRHILLIAIYNGQTLFIVRIVRVSSSLSRSTFLFVHTSHRDSINLKIRLPVYILSRE
jgi:hypothetical protein